MSYQIRTDTRQRIIRRHAGAPDNERWWGHVETPHSLEGCWKGRTVQEVTDQMNHEMGKQEDHEYHVTE